MAYGDSVSAGTVSGAAGSTVLTGVGTPWATGPMPLLDGDQIYVGGDVYPIAADASVDTSLNLGVPLEKNIAPGTAYRAVLGAPKRNATVQIASSIPDMIKLLNFYVESGVPVKCKAVGTNTPPATPSTGDRYVVGTAPTGAWAGNAGAFAMWTGSAWYTRPSSHGDMAIDLSQDELFFREAGAWLIRSLQVNGTTFTDNVTIAAGKTLRILGQPAVTAFRTGGFTALATGNYGWAGTLGLNQGGWTTATIAGAISGAGLVVPKTGFYDLSMAAFIQSGSSGRIYTTVNGGSIFSVLGNGGSTGFLAGASKIFPLTAGDVLGLYIPAPITLYLDDAHTYLCAAMIS